MNTKSNQGIFVKTARIQTNPTKRIALGVVTFALLQSLKTAMHTLPKLSSTYPNGDAAIASVRRAGRCMSFATFLNQRHSDPVSLYGHEWNAANIRGGNPQLR